MPGFEAVSLSLPVIIGLGAIDAINPCVIGVLLLLLAVLLKTGDKSVVWKHGLAYTGAVYLTYTIAGLTLLSFFNAIRSVSTIAEYLYMAIGVLVLLAGTWEVKDFFWYGKWFSLAIPKRFISTIETRVQTAHLGIASAALFGFIITLVELPCTGAPYLAILTLMSQSGLSYVKSLPLLLLYNFVFVLPLIVIIAMASAGVSLEKFHVWKQEKRGTMRLAIGLALWAVGVWIITAIEGALLWPLIYGLLGLLALMAVAKYIFKFR